MKPLYRMLNNEDGTSVTEFVIVLPIFIMTFIAVINMGEWGVESTAVRMDAQKNMWADAIPVSYEKKAIHMTPIGGAGDAADGLIDGGDATSSDAKIGGYVVEGAVMIAMGAGGHFGESYARILPAQLHPEFNVDDVHMKPSDLTDRPFPRKVIDDSVVDFDRGQGGNLMDIVTEVIGSSGAFQAVGAGMRYGDAFGSASRDVSLSVLGDESLVYHNDVAVAPQPLKGLETKATFGIAWVLAQTQDNYYNLFVFGDGDGLSSSGGGGGGAPSGVPNPGDIIDEYNEENDSKDDQVGDAEEELAEQQAEEEEGG